MAPPPPSKPNYWNLFNAILCGVVISVVALTLHHDFELSTKIQNSSVQVENCINLETGQKDHASLKAKLSALEAENELLSDEFRLYEKTIDEMGNEKLDLINKIDMFKEKKELAEKAYEEQKKAYDELKVKFDFIRQKHPDTEVEDHKDPEVPVPQSDDADDKQHHIYCALDDLFESDMFPGSCMKPSSGEPRIKECPFHSAQHAISELKLHPEWIKIQQADRCSKERKKLYRQLSKKLHPDKIVKLGCPTEYGEVLMKVLNVLIECNRVLKDREVDDE